MAKKERLDTLLVHLGHFQSREQAQRAILAGWVKVNQQPATKAGMSTDPAAPISVDRPGPGYASRGAHKLLRALEVFHVPIEARVALDVGASTGGFTDVLLRHGARQVYAIDVGYGQLAWELRQDPRVIVMERKNVRHMTPEQLQGETPDLAVIDVSFIGLGKVLPAIRSLLSPPGDVIALIKPQFEAGPADVGKGGVVRDPAIHQRVIVEVLAQASHLGYHLQGLTYSPIKGPEGNIEFLAHWRPDSPGHPPSPESVVAAAHREL